MTLSTRTQNLIAELSDKVGLEAVDAHRGAFTALACANGWSKSEIGRWLGISRARVGQKADKLLHYSTTVGRTPVLTGTMRKAVRIELSKDPYSDVVGFDVKDWDDLDLARSLLEILESRNAKERSRSTQADQTDRSSTSVGS